MKQKKLLKKKLLLLDYNQLSRDEILATVKEIIVNLHNHFKEHIGFDESTSPHEIFQAITEIDPTTLSIYKQEYWWNMIKRTMSNLRTTEDLFIIHRGHKWFVLKTRLELSQYKHILSRGIKGMEQGKIKADRWVNQSKWRNI